MNFKIPSFEKCLFSACIDVRVCDLNYGNHLGHDSLVSFFHEARSRFFRSIGYTELNICGLSTLVKNLAINYSSEAFHMDKILIEIGIGEINNASIELLYRAINTSTMREAGSAITKIVFYDHKKSKLARVPNEFISAIMT